MSKAILLAPAAALLSSASPGPVMLQPGQWETAVQYESIKAPGVSPAELASIREMMSGPQTQSLCLTPADAADPIRKLTHQGDREHSCRYGPSTFAGGAIRASGICQAAGVGSSTFNVEGSFTATTMTAHLVIEIRPAAGTASFRKLRLTGTMNGRRTGDCTP